MDKETHTHTIINNAECNECCGRTLSKELCNTKKEVNLTRRKIKKVL